MVQVNSILACSLVQIVSQLFMSGAQFVKTSLTSHTVMTCVLTRFFLLLIWSGKVKQEAPQGKLKL